VEPHPDVDRPPEMQAVEPIRRHAGDSRFDVVDLQRRGTNVAAAAKLALTHAMADDDALVG
jgi:hypothetical protein